MTAVVRLPALGVFLLTMFLCMHLDLFSVVKISGLKGFHLACHRSINTLPLNDCALTID